MTSLFPEVQPFLLPFPQRVPHVTPLLGWKDSLSLPPALPSQPHTDPSHLHLILSSLCLPSVSFSGPLSLRGQVATTPAGDTHPSDPALSKKRRQPWSFPAFFSLRVTRLWFQRWNPRFKEAHLRYSDQHHHLPPGPLIWDCKCTKVTAGREIQRGD